MSTEEQAPNGAVVKLAGLVTLTDHERNALAAVEQNTCFVSMSGTLMNLRDMGMIAACDPSAEHTCGWQVTDAGRVALAAQIPEGGTEHGAPSESSDRGETASGAASRTVASGSSAEVPLSGRGVDVASNADAHGDEHVERDKPGETGTSRERRFADNSLRARVRRICDLNVDNDVGLAKRLATVAGDYLSVRDTPDYLGAAIGALESFKPVIVTAREVAHEVDVMFAGGGDGGLEKCPECDLGPIGFLRDAMDKLRPQLAALPSTGEVRRGERSKPRPFMTVQSSATGEKIRSYGPEPWPAEQCKAEGCTKRRIDMSGYCGDHPTVEREPDWKDHYARVASALGITYDAEGQGQWPGPIEAVLAYIEELKAAQRELLDAKTAATPRKAHRFERGQIVEIRTGKRAGQRHPVLDVYLAYQDDERPGVSIRDEDTEIFYGLDEVSSVVVVPGPSAAEETLALARKLASELSSPPTPAEALDSLRAAHDAARLSSGTAFEPSPPEPYVKPERGGITERARARMVPHYQYARAVARKASPRADGMTDAQLDVDPFVEWVACLFGDFVRKHRDEAQPGERSAHGPSADGWKCGHCDAENRAEAEYCINCVGPKAAPSSSVAEETLALARKLASEMSSPPTPAEALDALRAAHDAAGISSGLAREEAIRIAGKYLDEMFGGDADQEAEDALAALLIEISLRFTSATKEKP